MQKVRPQIDLKWFLWLKKVKCTVPLTYVYNDFNGKEIAGTFYEKELWKKKNQKSLDLKTKLTEKVQKYT